MEGKRTSYLRQYSTRTRRLFLQTVGAAGVGIATSNTVSASDSDDPTEIDSCTVIDEPGEYELVSDIEPDTTFTDQSASLEDASCIEIRAINVTLRGNGHTIDGHGAQEGDRFRGAAVGVNIGATPTQPDVFEQLENITVENLHITGFGAGIRYEEVVDGRIAGITAHDNGSGVSFTSNVVGVSVENCRLTGGNQGFSTIGDPDIFGGPQGNRVQYCTIEENTYGISLGMETHDHEINDCRIMNNGHGATHSPLFNSGHVYHNNAICANRVYGILNMDSPEEEPYPRMEDIVEAMENFWGAENGPSSFGDPPEPFTDPETGRAADGDGDAISESLEPGVANVRFDPFLDSFPDDVGADL